MNTPNCYAIIPAPIRYSQKLSTAEKILFAEITALSSKEGYCWANNTYFAKLYGVTNRTIIRWLNNLKTEGFVRIEYQNPTNLDPTNVRKIFINENIASVLPYRHPCL